MKKPLRPHDTLGLPQSSAMFSLIALLALLLLSPAARAGDSAASSAAAATGGVGERRVLHPDFDPPFGRADAVVDLATNEGAQLVHGHWAYRSAELQQASVRAPGTGTPATGFDLTPAPTAAGFEASGWQAIAPEQLRDRRATSRVSFGWYRLDVVLPERIGPSEVRGSTLVLETVVDDYAEIWVDGRLAPTLGQRGGSLIAGWNAPNRVMLTSDARPGQRIQVAILAINGPLSVRPDNFIWVRNAALELYRPRTDKPVARGQIERLAPAMERLFAADAVVEQVVSGCEFTEGPVWSEGGLLFSDPNANIMYRYEPQGRLFVARVKSGYGGVDIARYRQPGSNGLAVDPEGRLTIDQHGNRRVIRVEKNGDVTVLADRYQGKRLNSPNDLVYRSDGTLFFTDPPFGLPGVFTDPNKELAYSGVYKLSNGQLELLTRELSGPNGIALSPDERVLYVGDWDPKHKVVMRYALDSAGHIAESRVFYDLSAIPGDEAIDGLEVDELGNVYVAAPGGVHVVTPQGQHVGTIHAAETPHNLTFGDADGRTLYLTALTGVYRVRTKVRGAAALH